MGFSHSEKRMVEINFDQLTQLQQLVEMGIDLDHHRTITEVHAFVTDEEFEQIQLLNFEIKEIPIIFRDRSKGQSKIPKIEIFRTLINLFILFLKKKIKG